MKRSALLVSLGMILTLSLAAQKSWEGSAAAGRYGEFPPEGYFGNSNSFPRNSIVDVVNLETGKSVRVIISGGLLDPSLFLVLSGEAAEAVGLERKDTARVRVSPVVVPGRTSPAAGFDLPYSVDPEVNPAAAAGDVNAGVDKRLPREPASAAAAVIVPAVPAEPEPEQAAAETPPEAEAPEAVIAAAPEPPAAPEAPAVPESVLPFVAAEGMETHEPEAPEFYEGPVAAAVAGGEGPEIPAEPEAAGVVTGDDIDRPAAPAGDAVVLLEPEEEKPPVSDEDAKESVEKLDTIIASIHETPAAEPVPAEPYPVEAAAPAPGSAPEPVVAAVPAAEAAGPADAWARSNLPLVASLTRKAYYLQVASFANPRGARPVVDALAVSYPVVVQPVGGDKPLYRVLVGPVPDDERGVLLHRLRATGYKDAFLRRGE